MSVCPLSARAEPSGGLQVVGSLSAIAGLEALITGRKETPPKAARPTLLMTVGTLLLSVAVGSIPFWAA